MSGDISPEECAKKLSNIISEHDSSMEQTDLKKYAENVCAIASKCDPSESIEKRERRLVWKKYDEFVYEVALKFGKYISKKIDEAYATKYKCIRLPDMDDTNWAKENGLENRSEPIGRDFCYIQKGDTLTFYECYILWIAHMFAGKAKSHPLDVWSYLIRDDYEKWQWSYHMRISRNASGEMLLDCVYGIKS